MRGSVESATVIAAKVAAAMSPPFWVQVACCVVGVETGRGCVGVGRARRSGRPGVKELMKAGDFIFGLREREGWSVSGLWFGLVRFGG